MRSLDARARVGDAAPGLVSRARACATTPASADAVSSSLSVQFPSGLTKNNALREKRSGRSIKTFSPTARFQHLIAFPFN
jgi:hypothetical protein